MISQSQTTAKYNEVLSKALMDLMARLNDHFNVDFDDSNLGKILGPRTWLTGQGRLGRSILV